MSPIRIDPPEVTAAGNELLTKATEVQAAQSRANALADQLATSWTGKRSVKFQANWADMRPQLQHAIETLEAAAQILKQAAIDFEIADEGG